MESQNLSKQIKCAATCESNAPSRIFSSVRIYQFLEIHHTVYSVLYNFVILDF